MSQTYCLPRPPTSQVPAIVTALWLVTTIIAFSFVAAFGSNAPYADEWEFVPALLNKEPLGAWLWKQHNEHRLPLSRIIFYGLFQLTHDFRAGMFLQVGLLSALALGLMQLARVLRGRADWIDLFFPVSLLHLGHWENLLMGYQICFVLFCCLATSLAVVALRTRRDTSFRSGVLAGALLLAIALTGGVGLAMIPVVALWIVYLAGIVWRAESPFRALILLALAAIPIAYIAVYFNDYERPAHHPEPSRDPLAIGMVTGEVLAMAFGIGISGVWWLVALGEVIAGVATLLFLRRHGFEAKNRPATLGLLAVAAGVFGLALAIGIARASFNNGLWSRYALLSWPLLAIAYLVWVQAGRRLVPMLFCIVSALAFVPNMLTGMIIGAQIREHYIQIENDVRAGVPSDEIVARRFPDSLNVGQQQRAEQNIPLLRSARIGIFGTEDR